MSEWADAVLRKAELRVSFDVGDMPPGEFELAVQTYARELEADAAGITGQDNVKAGLTLIKNYRCRYCGHVHYGYKPATPTCCEEAQASWDAKLARKLMKKKQDQQQASLL